VGGGNLPPPFLLVRIGHHQILPLNTWHLQWQNWICISHLLRTSPLVWWHVLWHCQLLGPAVVTYCQCFTVMYRVSRKTRDQSVFCNVFIKLGRFWWNLVHSFLDKFASEWYVFHLTWKMYLHYLVKLEMLNWTHATLEL